MKSQLQDPQIKTSCKNCLCAIYEDKTQVGCSFDRITKFGDNVIPAYDDEKEFYVIKRFCNYYRDNRWNKGVLDIEKIKHQSSISFDIFVICDNLDNDVDTDNLISILKNLNYYTNKVNISLVHVNTVSKNIRKNILKVFCEVKCEITETDNILEHVHNYLASSSSTYHIIVDMSNKSELHLISKLNSIINDDVKQATIFNLGTSKAISNIVYRIESSINNQVDYSINIANIITRSLESNMYIDVL